MEQNLASGAVNAQRPGWDASRLVPRIVHLGCGAFHRAHQALYTHRLLSISDSDWGICEVSLMSGRGAQLIRDLNAQNRLYTVAERGADETELHIIGAVVEALHPQTDGYQAILEALARPETAVVSLTITEKGYCTGAASGQLDRDNPLIQHDLAHPQQPQSAIGYLVEALAIRRRRGLPGFTVLSCDNVRENGHVAKAAVIGLAQARDVELAAWIAQHVTFPCTMVDRIVPAATAETLDEIARQLGVYDPCAIACEPFHQWVIEDHFVNGRPDWDRAGAQFVSDVVPFELMKLRMLNGSHTFLACLGYLAGYRTVAETMSDPEFRRAARSLMLDEQAPTLTMPPDTDLPGYAARLIARFSNPALKHQTAQIAGDSSQKLPQRLLDPIRQHLREGSDWRYLALGVAGWMRYVGGVDDRGNAYEVVDPLAATLQAISRQPHTPSERVRALLAIGDIFGSDLPAQPQFVDAVTAAYCQLLNDGAAATVAAR
ncbi:fructuronate reductase [Erwinia sp. SLM-02]|uniref:fructuronate reductase n=1 Tax=Erwinia sp. SLM-02 TaxID=3020057 RepID=UPI003080F648